MQTGAVKRITEGEGTATELDEALKHAALLWSTDASALEILCTQRNAAPQADQPQRRPHSPSNDCACAKPHSKDKGWNEVHALLTMPVGYVAGSKVPMLLRIYGGPTSQDAHGFKPHKPIRDSYDREHPLCCNPHQLSCYLVMARSARGWSTSCGLLMRTVERIDSSRWRMLSSSPGVMSREPETSPPQKVLITRSKR